ncbi:MAG: DUF4235 domain-containing protein [Bacteroidota bacterium]|nr:DUF4235 domain-containing protein [Bacteroidota bacterium]
MMSNQLKWKIVSNGAAILAAMAVRAILSKSWEAVRHESPPKNPESSDVQLKEALLWTIATAITAGVARLLAHRSAAIGWKKITGEMPPV